MSTLVRDESAWSDLDGVQYWGKIYDEKHGGGPRFLVMQGEREGVCQAVWTGWTVRDDSPRGVGHNWKNAIAALRRKLREAVT